MCAWQSLASILRIEEKNIGDVTVLSAFGKFTIGAGDAKIRETIQQAVQDGKRKLILNLGGVTTIDSSGIQELVVAFTSLSHKGGDVCLCCLPPKIQDILSVTQLISVFQIFQTEDEAIASFA